MPSPNRNPVIPTRGRRSRTWSTSCSSTTSQSSIASIYPWINQTSPPAEPAEGHPNVYGSFTTTTSATLPLRAHLSLHIPLSVKRSVKRPDLDCGYDTPPDSPLSFLHSLSGSRRSPSISRTLTDFDWDMRPAREGTSSPLTSPPSPSTDIEVNTARLHSVLEAVEATSKLSRKTKCSACMKTGTNFPRCPRCDAMWCSRACRLQGGKRHICVIRKL